MSLYAAVLQFPFPGAKRPEPVLAWQCLYEDMVCQDWNGKTLSCTVLTSTLMNTFWVELECKLHPKPAHPTLMPDLTNTLVAE